MVPSVGLNATLSVQLEFAAKIKDVVPAQAPVPPLTMLKGLPIPTVTVIGVARRFETVTEFVTLVPAATDPKFTGFGFTSNGCKPTPKRETLCEMLVLSVTVMNEVTAPAPVPSLATVGVNVIVTVQFAWEASEAGGTGQLLAIENGLPAAGVVMVNVTAEALALEMFRFCGALVVPTTLSKNSSDGIRRSGDPPATSNVLPARLIVCVFGVPFTLYVTGMVTDCKPC